jgi:two-component system, OmpR family, response regulator ChvI
MARTALGRARVPTIGLVTSDQEVLTAVTSALEEEGHTVLTYTDGKSALTCFKTTPLSLAIFEIRAPRVDGGDLLRRLRQTNSTPVILLTSTNEEIDEIIGLRMGADDVIHKPFSRRVLVQRVDTLLRRNIEDTKTENYIIECGQLRIDTARHVCTWKDQAVCLTRAQISLLRAMSRRPGIVMSRGALIEAVYDKNARVNERAIDTLIKHLRKKFQIVDDSFDMIETINGIGYRLKEASILAIRASGSDRHVKGL